MLFSQTFAEAGGKLTGKVENAAAGLETKADSSGAVWAWYQTQWAKIHTLKSGQTLWSLAIKYYGNGSGWTKIRDFGPNKSIVGADGASAFAGERILIPGLPAPFPPPSAQLPAPSPGAPLSKEAPAGWPAAVPWPPGESPELPPPEEPLPVVYQPTAAQGAAAGSAAAAAGEPPKPFWTTGRIAVAAGAGAIGVGLIVYLATRKRRNPRRRKKG